METIDNYLDALFASYPPTPQVLEAKAELRSMMEDAYTGARAAGRSRNEALGQAISEFGNLQEVAPLLGLHQEAQEEAISSSSEPARPTSTSRPKVSLAQAANYAAVLRQTRWLLAVGVAIFVVAPIPLVSLTTASSTAGPTTSAYAVAIGFLVLLPLVAVGVGLLVIRSQRLSSFTLITSGKGEIPPEVEAFGRSVKEEHSNSYTRALVGAIALWILSALPVVLVGVMTEGMPQVEADRWIALGVAGTLLLVAGGLLLLLSHNWPSEVAERLSPEGASRTSTGSAPEDLDQTPAWARAFYAGFWPAIVAIYLTWSFVADAWAVSWIIWPIAGVVFGGVAAIVGAIFPSAQN